MTSSGIPRIRRLIDRSLVNLRIELAARRSLERLGSDDRRLVGLAAAARTRCDELRAEHDEYVRDISSSDMAVSLTTAGLLAALYTALAPRVVLDLGSGFSTYVAHRYASGAEVIGVDDDRLWLERTGEYLTSKGFPSSTLVPLDDLDSVAARPDVVFYDLGRMETRASNLDRALSLVQANGLVVIDDLHKFPYCQQVLKRTRRDGTMYWTRGLTLDNLGRFSAIWRAT